MIDIAILDEAGLTPDQILRVVRVEQQRELKAQAAAREKERQRGRERRTQKLQQLQQSRPENPAASKESTASKDASTLTSLLPLVALTEFQESKEVVVEGRRASDWPSNYRELFWDKYPNKVGKPKALSKLDRVRQRGVPWGEIWDGLERYVVKNDDRAWCNPETWVNQERWADQPAKVNGANGYGKRSVADVADDLIARAEERERAAGLEPGNGTFRGFEVSKDADR